MKFSELELAKIYAKFIAQNTNDKENNIIDSLLSEQNIDTDIFWGWIYAVKKCSGELQNDILSAKESLYGEYCNYGHFLVEAGIIPTYSLYHEPYSISEEMSQAMERLAHFFCRDFCFYKHKGKIIVYKKAKN